MGDQVICSLCGKYEERSRGSQLPTGWTRVYVTVKHQATTEMDIRTREGTRVRMVKDYCVSCGPQVVYSKLNANDLSLKISVDI